MTKTTSPLADLQTTGINTLGVPPLRILAHVTTALNAPEKDQAREELASAHRELGEYRTFLKGVHRAVSKEMKTK